MKKSTLLLITPVLFTIFSIAAYGQIILQPFTTFGTNGDGSLRPGDLTPDLSASSQLQRGMAYNPTTGHLLVVDRSTNAGINYAVNIIDGNTGAHLGALDTSSGDILSTGGNTAFILNLVGVASDGSIYAANLSSGSSPPQYRLYRWASETNLLTRVLPNVSSPNDDPSNGNTNISQRRWGDTMTVRGSGIGTEILIGNRGTLAALLTPTDNTLTAFTAKTLTTDVPVGGLSIGLSFGAGNTFWGTSGGFGNGPLLHLSYNATAGTATTLQTFASPTFPGTISPILVIPSSNLLAGITMVPGADVVRLYDISGLPNAPVLLDRKSFPTANNNANFAGALALGTNGVLYALDSDNGIMAFTLSGGTSGPLAPAFYLNPATQLAIAGNPVTLTSAADGAAPITYQWRLGGTNISGATNASFTITNVQGSDAGSYSVVASNSVTNVTSSTGVLSVAVTPPTTLLLYDSIPYAPGVNIAGQGSWSAPTAAQTNTFKATNGNLSIAGLAPAQGNMITWSNTPVASIRITNGPITAVGSIYFSFAYRVDNLGTLGSTTGSTIAAFVSDFTTANYATKIDVKADPGAGGYNIGVFKGTGEVNGGFATNVLALSSTNFIVGRYIYSDGAADDTCALWINPSSSTFSATNPPTPTVGDIGTGATDFGAIVGFAFRSSGGPVLSFADEVRVGLTWADVTPVPSLTPGLKIAVASPTSVLLSWPSTATGFNLERTPSLNTPITWAPVTNSVTVIGTNNNVNVSAATGSQFFRLRKSP